MDNLIEQIVAIDKDARDKVNSAKIKADGLISDANSKKSDMKNDFSQRADRRLEKVLESYSTQADEEIKEIDRRKDEICRQLDEKMNTNREKWENEIFARIVGE